MPLTMPTMRVNAPTADVGSEKSSRRADDVPCVVRTYGEFAISFEIGGFYASFRANSTNAEHSETAAISAE